MKLNELQNSKWIKEDDVIPDILVTIKSEEKRDMAKTGQPSDIKLVLGFEETLKLILYCIANYWLFVTAFVICRPNRQHH